MASYTSNLNLKKPAGSENVAIGDINNNMDTIDNAYGGLKLRRKIVTYTNVTISSNDAPFVELDTYTNLGVSNTYYCIAMLVRGWSGSSIGCFNVVKNSSGGGFYLLGSKAGSVSSITIEYFFSPTADNMS